MDPDPFPRETDEALDEILARGRDDRGAEDDHGPALGILQSPRNEREEDEDPIPRTGLEPVARRRGPALFAVFAPDGQGGAGRDVPFPPAGVIADARKSAGRAISARVFPVERRRHRARRDPEGLDHEEPDAEGREDGDDEGQHAAAPLSGRRGRGSRGRGDRGRGGRRRRIRGWKRRGWRREQGCRRRLGVPRRGRRRGRFRRRRRDRGVGSRRRRRRPGGRRNGRIRFHQVSVCRMERNAAWGIWTRPTFFMRFFPSFCFSRSFRFRLTSPP